VTLVLAPEGSASTVTIQIPSPGPDCPQLNKTYEARSLQLSPSTVTFVDPAGQVWNLGLREGALRGIIAWQAGAGADDPLAPATSALTRLGGEVTLARMGGPPGPPPRGKTTFGGATKGVGTVIAAAAVGLGVFAAVSIKTQDTKNQGNGGVVCSPRVCTNVIQNDPTTCSTGCNTSFLSGGQCGTTNGGVAINQPCSLPDQPCQTDLSCDNRICRNPSLCPF
jgi:hypothetical protein